MARLMSRLPFWAYFLIAIGFLYLAYQDFENALQEEREKALALTAPPPAAVDLSRFDRARDVGPADEVVVIGRIDTAYNYSLVKKTNGVTTGERFMYVLFGAQDPAGTRTVRAAMVMTEAQKDRFVERLFDFARPDAGSDLVLRLHGQARSSVAYSTLAHDALREKDLTRGEDFIFIEPFLDGRAAGLAPAEALELLPKEGLLLALVCALAGVGKLLVRRRRRRPAALPAAGGRASRDPAVPPMPRPARPTADTASAATADGQAAFSSSGLDADSPLMRIRQREAAHRISQVPASSDPTTSDAPIRSVERRHVRVPRMAMLLLVSGAIYLGVWQLDTARVDRIMGLVGLPPVSLDAGLVAMDGGMDATSLIGAPVVEVASANVARPARVREADGTAAARGAPGQPQIVPPGEAATAPKSVADTVGDAASLTGPRPVPAPRADDLAPAAPPADPGPARNAPVAAPAANTPAPGGDIVALALPVLSLAVAGLIVVRLLRLLAGLARPGGLLRRRPDPFDRLAAEARRG